MEFTIQEIYAAIIQKCAFINAPRLIVEHLNSAEAARYGWVTTGKGFEMRTIDQSIHADKDYFKDLDPEQVTAILAHELAHWICHWHCTTGGDMTEDGQHHGARFLAVWLSIWKTLGKTGEALEAEAHWHAQAYSLSTAEMQRALSAAIATDNAQDAIIAARPPVNRKDETLYLLRFCAWMALAGSALALIWHAPVTAAISCAMMFACTFLIFKVKNSSQQIVAGA